VRDVAVDEHLPRRQSDDLVGGHAAVGAPDPEMLRRLLSRERLEEVRILLGDAARPRAVVLEEPFEVAHPAENTGTATEFPEVQGSGLRVQGPDPRTLNAEPHS